MGWWQFCLLLLGIGVVSWLIPALLFGYLFGAVASSIAGRGR